MNDDPDIRFDTPNDYDAPSDQAPILILDETPPENQLKRPRSPLWSIIAAILVPLASIAASLVLSTIVLVGFLFATEGPEFTSSEESFSDALIRLAGSPWGMLAILAPGQFAFLATACFATLFSSKSWTGSLNLWVPQMSTWKWMAFVFATPLVNLLVVQLINALFPDGESTSLEMLEQMINQQQGLSMVLVYLLIAVAPGICEELMFRGYCQSRLSTYLPLWLTLFVSSSLFAIAHLDLIQGVAVFFLGIWFGLVAWRTGSVYPAMLCHFVNNAFSTLAMPLLDSKESALPFSIFTVTVSGLAMAMALTILATTPRGWGKVIRASSDVSVEPPIPM
jgi:uncharacterized protein